MASPVRTTAAGTALALLTAAYVLSYVDRTILSLMVGPIRADLALSDTEFSLLGGLAFALFYSLLGIPLGWWADRGNRPRIIALGIVLWSGMTILCGFATGFSGLFAARVGVGIGEAALGPAAYSLIAELYPRHKIGRALAIYGAGVYFGIGISFAAGGWLIEQLGQVSLGLAPWQAAFVLVGLPGLILAPLIALHLKDPRSGLGAGVSTSGPALMPWLRSHWRFIVPHFLGFAMLTMAFNGYLAWGAEYFFRAFGWSKANGGLALGLLVLFAGIGGMLSGGIVTDARTRAGDRRAPMSAAFGGALAMLPFPLLATTTGSPWLSLAALFPIIAGSAFCFGPAITALQLATPPGLRGRVSALYLLVVNLAGIGFGGTAVALVSDRMLKDEALIGLAMGAVGGAGLMLAVPLLWLARSKMPDNG